MANSMTGFGRATVNDEDIKIVAEIKSVNSRYFELINKIPKQINYFEDSIKSMINSKISRGRVELYIQIENESVSDNYNINCEKISQYKKIFDEIQKSIGIENDMKISSYLNLPEVMTKNYEPNTKIEQLVLNCVSKALDFLCKLREIEGEKIIYDLLKRVDTIETMIYDLEKYTQDMMEFVFEKLQKRLSEILSKNSIELDPVRVLQESAIYADKSNITEEIVRFNTHIVQLRNFLKVNDEDIGKKIDFLIQEMNREINTIGSKSQKIEIISIVVNIKAELEKIREQIQNIQ